jgi:predicted methyltransferase
LVKTTMSSLSRRDLVVCAAAAALAGCKRPYSASARPPAAGPASGSLEWAVAGDWRSPADKARDRWRHPLESLKFWGFEPTMTVVEFWPGAGWYTDILAPCLTAAKGRLYAALLEPDDAAARMVDDAYRNKLAARPGLYGAVSFTSFGPSSGSVAPAGSADLVLFLRNLHNWMAAGLAEKAFRDALAALKPGGLLGVEEHRARPGGVQDAMAASGYVQEAYVRQLAKEAGFQFVGSSEINANTRDTGDHPFGVWTLPPARRSSPRGQPPNPSFDHSRYDAIGESDRMTLKFAKPGGPGPT